MTTSIEFMQAEVTGQTHREIREQFGTTFNDLVKAEDIMANFALAFAFFRQREHLHLPDAYEKAMGLSTDEVKDLFDDEPKTAKDQAVVDFASPRHTTTP